MALAAPLLTICGGPLLWTREKIVEKPGWRPVLLSALALAWGLGVYLLAVLAWALVTGR